jgi:nucleoside-diphosphate-sugar epimerase
MKVILTGSTGFVGGEVLSQCLQNPAITSIVAISRRALPSHKKLQVALIEDFLSYPDSIRDQIKDANACIWYDPSPQVYAHRSTNTNPMCCRTLGKARIPDNETAQRVSVDYTLAAVRVLQEIGQKPFRFIYCSGAAAERDQTKPLWIMQDYRRIRVWFLIQAVNYIY